MRFVDQITLTVCGGSGGAGCLAFTTAAHRRRTPDGGNGGNGGGVYFQGTTGLNTLHQLAAYQLIRATAGQPGRTNRRHGKNGVDTVVQVPLGTVIFDLDDHQLVCDVTAADQRYCVARGGQGGVGNAYSGRSHAPYRRLASLGQYRRLRCELKLLADVGLVGLPNAGKSSLLTALSNRRCRAAPFAFCTLVPSLGVVQTSDHRGYTVADLPGLIAGSHRGRGLGIGFLRHVERCTMLALVLDGAATADPPPLVALQVLMHELRCFNPRLLAKPLLVVLNKSDLPAALASSTQLQPYVAERVPIVSVSATKQLHLTTLTTVLARLQRQVVRTVSRHQSVTRHHFDFRLRFTDFCVKRVDPHS